VKPGGNRLIWNLRYPGFDTFAGMVLYSSPNRGPKAVPGTYKVRLTVNGKQQEQNLTIVKDPRLPNSDADYKAQFDFLMAVRDQVSMANNAISDIRNIKKDLAYLKEKGAGHADILTRVGTFEKSLTEVENNIHMTRNKSRQDPLNYGIRINNRLAFLMADSQRGDYPPTDQALAFFEEVKAELRKELNALDALVKTHLDEINAMVSQKGIRMISKEE
jgi:hypothetical protein